MKEALGKHLGHLKTEDVLAFYEGLREQQAICYGSPPILSRITLRMYWFCWEMPMLR